MKSISIILCLIFSLSAMASNINSVTARKAAENKLMSLPATYQIQTEYSLSAGNVNYYVYTLTPSGFIIITGNTQLAPVYAYSLKGTFDISSPLISYVSDDIRTRFQSLNLMPENIKAARESEWTQLLSGKRTTKEFQQWPEATYSPTEGWLWENWTQSYPYNMMCPIDQTNSTRSLAGCPSVAMAMILNFHKTINGVEFSDADDYYHGYAGNYYSIDDDYEAIGFPSWTQLNQLLGTLSGHYHDCIGADDTDKGALTYACGVAATQVYTSGGSGTFGVIQAWEAYQKFNFEQTLLITDTTSGFYTTIMENIIDTLPVHLAVVTTDNMSGHNVVIDGYNTNGYFHLNFGWGGSYNGWYSLPDEIPYGLTVIEGAVVNIIPSESVNSPITKNSSFKVYPNPVSDFLFVEANTNGTIATICNLTGATIKSQTLSEGQNSISIKGIPAGVFILKLNSTHQTRAYKFIVSQ